MKDFPVLQLCVHGKAPKWVTKCGVTLRAVSLSGRQCSPRSQSVSYLITPSQMWLRRNPSSAAALLGQEARLNTVLRSCSENSLVKSFVTPPGHMVPVSPGVWIRPLRQNCLYWLLYHMYACMHKHICTSFTHTCTWSIVVYPHTCAHLVLSILAHVHMHIHHRYVPMHTCTCTHSISSHVCTHAHSTCVFLQHAHTGITGVHLPCVHTYTHHKCVSPTSTHAHASQVCLTCIHMYTHHRCVSLMCI